MLNGMMLTCENCVCMYVCISVGMCVCVRAHIHTHAHTYVNAYMLYQHPNGFTQHLLVEKKVSVCGY